MRSAGTTTSLSTKRRMSPWACRAPRLRAVAGPLHLSLPVLKTRKRAANSGGGSDIAPSLTRISSAAAASSRTIDSSESWRDCQVSCTGTMSETLGCSLVVRHCDFASGMITARECLSAHPCASRTARLDPLLDLAGDELLQLHDIGRELADTFAGFFVGHRVVIKQIPEFFLIQFQPLNVGGFRLFRVEFALHRTGRLRKIGEQLRTDGEQIAAGELEDLRSVSEAGAHYFRAVTELLVVGVDLLHRLHARIFRAGVVA